MTIIELQTVFCRSLVSAVILLAATCASSSVFADDSAEIRLRNGTILRGKYLLMNSLAGRAIGAKDLGQTKDEAPDPHNIGRIDNGWQRYYFNIHQRQAAPGGVELNLAAPRQVIIPFQKPIRKSTGGIVTSFGSITFSDPFTEFGRRRLTITTEKGPTDVFQAIIEAAPDHVLVESTNFDWRLGLPLKSIPVETIDRMVKKQIKQDDPVARFQVVLFYTQAELYAQAFSELDSFARDFPNQKEKVEKSREELMNFWGREILRNLRRRKQAGQHQIAVNSAKTLMSQPLSGPVALDVRQFFQTYEQASQKIDDAKLWLSDWQSKLDDPAREKLLQSVRSEINDQLDFETLPRLDAFLKAEADKQYDPSQRLGLAISGWLLGSANAVPDLDRALRIWDARHVVIDYLESDDPAIHSASLATLKSLESVSPQTILNLIPQLPPLIDASDLKPGILHRVQTAANEGTGYSVILPEEYSRHHSYPMIVVLRSRNRTIEQSVALWAGDSEHPGLANQRGYITIAPDYAEKNQTEHTYGAPVHKYVLDCLIDARKRFSVDSDRVFLTGHGMGADAAFDIGMAHPDEFAGVLPIGGNALQYCNYTWSNGRDTAWYVVGKGYFDPKNKGDVTSNRDPASNAVFDKMLQQGIRFDFTLVEYLGRNGENLFDDFSKLFEWMDLHVRATPPKDLDYRSLRKSDNRFFWVTAPNLPRDYILPAPPGAAQKVNPMKIDARVTPGNTLILKGPTENYILRLTPQLVDFDKKLTINLNGHLKSMFIKPELNVPLEELRVNGDRKRLPLAIVTP